MGTLVLFQKIIAYMMEENKKLCKLIIRVSGEAKNLPFFLVVCLLSFSACLFFTISVAVTPAFKRKSPKERSFMNFCEHLV